MLIRQSSIPVQALDDSREYASRYEVRPDLISIFPAFSLDDPSQLPCSLGGGSWQSITDRPTIQDWFPSSVDYHSVISILVRPCVSAPAHSIPLTIMTHFAPADGSRSRKASAATSPALGVAGPSRRSPRVVTVAPSASVDELKAVVLEADGRRVARLEKVVLWKVEMSESEMIVIEERGGLKSGQMPWPYPPTAEVPTKLEHDTVGTYWSASKPRMVSLSVWLSPSAHAATACARVEIPNFTYPMNFPAIVRRASTSNSLPERSPPAPPSPPQVIITPVSEPVAEHHAITMPPRARRARPSTAPALSTGQPSFGFGSSKRQSPLARPPLHVDTALQQQPMQGLGIASPVESPLEVDMSNLQLHYEIGQEMHQEGKVVWYSPSSSSRRPTIKRHDTVSSIRSFANNRALRAHEVA